MWGAVLREYYDKDLEEQFNEYHKKEFDSYMKYLEDKHKQSTEDEKTTKPCWLEAYWLDVYNTYNQEEDESYLDIGNWNKKK